MTRNLRSKLERHRNSLVRSVSDRVICDAEMDVSAEVHRIAVLDKMLSYLPVPIWQRLWSPLFVALACITAVGASWVGTIDQLGIRTGVVLALNAETASFLMDSDWALPGRIRLEGQELRIERASLKLSDPALAFGSLGDNARLHVESNSELTLQRLALKSGTEFTLQMADGDKVTLYAVGAGASGEILINGTSTLEWSEGNAPHQSRTFSLEIPETITFSISGQLTVPARIEFQPTASPVLHNLYVSRLRFGREVAMIYGQPGFVSTIQSGQVRLLDVDQIYDLFPGDGLILHDLKGRVRQAQIGGPISIDLEGTVKQLSVGPRGQERDVTPSVLSYVYHNQQLAFLFSAASFIWGLLWSFRRLINV